MLLHTFDILSVKKYKMYRWDVMWGLFNVECGERGVQMKKCLDFDFLTVLCVESLILDLDHGLGLGLGLGLDLDRYVG